MEEQQITIPLSLLRDLYWSLGQLANTAATVRKDLQSVVLETMGDREEIPAGEGWTFALETRLSQVYPKPALEKVFDADAMALILQPVNTKVRELLKTMKIPAEMARELDKSMETTGTVRALKLKPPKGAGK